MFRMIAFIFVGCVALLSFKENPSVSYISQYKEIAISEMLRTGIPASIKMAQALLESGAGQSTLAMEANNHFGIKCGGGWNGDEFYREDDDYHKGQLIKSCFRKFESVADSYIAHSDFLTEQQRYAFLFSIDRGDYHSWAYGLKRAGYATDKKYSHKLIEIIEKYELYTLDEGYISDMILADNGNNAAGTAKRKNRISEDGVSYEEAALNAGGIFIYPGAKLQTEKDISRKGENRNTRHSTRASYNDDTHHIVLSGEKMADIAKRYDLDENAIRMRNRIPKDAEPLAGEKIYLRKYISLSNRPQFMRFESDQEIAAEDEYIF